MIENTDSTSLENEQRMDALELKLMDLENTVQELNEVILRQYRDIDRLTKVQQELLNRMADGGANAEASPSALDELPPHY